MNKNEISQRIHALYWDEDINCASTMLKILAENYGTALGLQVLDAATGMHGAGGYRAQCGLVEGTLMFIGIYGKSRGMGAREISGICFQFAQSFEKEMHSLACRYLRPEGFHEKNPPHLCEALTNRAVQFSIAFLHKHIECL